MTWTTDLPTEDTMILKEIAQNMRKPAKKKLCILCHKNPPAVPDREQMGRRIKRVCLECHRNRLRADSERAMYTLADQYLAKVKGDSSGPSARLTEALGLLQDAQAKIQRAAEQLRCAITTTRSFGDDPCNPRLRDGWPSETALDAHDGWVIWVETVGAYTIWDAATVRERKQHAPDAKVRVWPCDANGNKVRWTTDEHGNLL